LILQENIFHSNNPSILSIQSKVDSTSRLPSKEGIELENLLLLAFGNPPLLLRLGLTNLTIEHPFIFIIIFKIIVVIDGISQFLFIEKFSKLRIL